MSEPIKNVVVLGATGTVGTVLVSELLNAGFTVTALSRPSSTSNSTTTTKFPPSVKVVQCSYTDLEALTTIFTNQHAVISTVAPFGIPDSKTAIDAAVQARVRQFIPSEYGLDSSLAHAAEVAPFVVGKQNILRYLKEKEGDGLSWTAVCNAAFFPWQLELGSGRMGWDVLNHRATLFDGGTQPYDASTIPQLARAVVSVLNHPTETANTHVYIKSFTLTQRRVVEALERHTGCKFEISHASAVEVQQEGMALIKQGDLKNGYPKTVTGVAFGPFGLSAFGDKTDRWMDVLGLKLEEDRFDEVVKESVDRIMAGAGSA